MNRFLTDEDFDNDILRAALRQLPELDVVRVQDVELMNVDDTIILAWAAQVNRVMLTHDVNTMNGSAFSRVREGLPMPGVIAVRKLAPIAQSITDLVYIVQAAEDEDLRDQVRYIPL